MNAVTYLNVSGNTLLNNPVIAGLSALNRLELQNTGINSLGSLLSSPFLTTVVLHVNNLNQSSVDGALSDLVTNGKASGYFQINQGTNAVPSSSGASNKAILVGRGWNVITN